MIGRLEITQVRKLIDDNNLFTNELFEDLFVHVKYNLNKDDWKQSVVEVVLRTIANDANIKIFVTLTSVTQDSIDSK